MSSENNDDYYLFNNVPIGICIINKNFDVLFWNSQLEYWTGVNHREIINQSIFNINPRLNDYKYRSRIEDIFNGGPPSIFSSQIHGTLFPPVVKEIERKIQHTTVSPLPSNNGSCFNAIFSIEDVTELSHRIREHRKAKELALEEVEQRKKIESTLKASETKLRELIATKDKFFSIIAHDLKNPLSVMLTVSDFLKSIYDELSPKEIKDFVVDINKATKNIFGLLENLLTWSRLERGKMPFKPELFDLSKVVANNVELLKLNAESKEISLFSSVPVHSLIFADINMITTVIRNLVSNAVKFTKKGGTVEIKSSFEKDYFDVTVSDTGVGISEEDIAKLFRIDVSHYTVGTGEEKGTGLGLIMCKEFIDKHNGKIWVESKFGEGSEFIFRIPIEQLNVPKN